MEQVLKWSVILAEDKQTVRLGLRRDDQAVWDDLAPEDVDLLIDALCECASRCRAGRSQADFGR